MDGFFFFFFLLVSEVTRDIDQISLRYDYEPAEQLDENEPEDFINPEDYEAPEGGLGGYEDENYGPTVNGDQTIVSGDPNAGYSGKVVEQAREKKVPNDERATTPYMTKYERARVLGTRALQIRYDIDDLGSSQSICR